MKKITFLMLHLNYGGLEKQTITLINMLAKTNKFDIEIISVYDLLNGKSFYDIDSSVKIRFLAGFGPDHKKIKEAKENHNFLKLIKYGFLGIKCLYYKTTKLKKEIAKLDSDIIFSTRIEFAKLISRNDTLNISQEHSFIDTPEYVSKIKQSFSNVDYVVVMTDKAKAYYEKYLGKKIVKIPNMIEDINDGKTAKFDNKKIISVGRLEEEKDFLTLIDVFNNVHKENSDVTLEIIGEGREREKIENEIKSFGLENFVKVTGKLNYSELNSRLINSSVYVLTSKCESFSLVICEAMRAGLPVVSFDIDVGPREIIENGVNGILVESRNVSDMSAQICSLLSSEEKWQKLSLNSLESVKKYFDYNVINSWLDLLE